MDIKISKFKILWKGLFGGKEAVFDYLLDVANSAAARIPDATKEQLARLYGVLCDVRGRIDGLSWLCPRAWTAYYVSVLSCIDIVIDALRDGRVERAELDRVVAGFQQAYAAWRAD